ncbi:MAG: HAMP domain-containing sensor histidine kinase [Crocosphaera sp.]|nr:HAMP domain-containing sensor histidine kinase [Crocosphaera sp.]
MMFSSVRFRLFLRYFLIMEAVLILFGGGIYYLFTRHLNNQVDSSLMTLAEAVTPTFTEVKYNKTSVLENLNNNRVLNPKTQSVEWFDNKKSLIQRYGEISISRKPEPGLSTLYYQNSSSSFRVRTATFSISINNEPNLDGYVRITQSLEGLEKSNEQLFFILLITAIVPLTLTMIGGWWLTGQAVEPIEEVFKQQQQFTADASHELRGPLTAIKASIDLMRRHPERFNQKDIRKIKAIANATEQMTGLVEDLLFLARTDKRNVQSEDQYKPIVINNMLQQLVDLVAGLAEEKKISLFYQESQQVEVMGNEDQLNRLFANLLYNALNYTPANGSIFVRLVQQNRVVKVAVEDTGIGIAAQDLPHVFDRFWRADESRHYVGGTGLGLPIAQAIASCHRGKITVDSQVGIGTCFEVSLPVLLESSIPQPV